jgi:hypothetical protein
MSRLVRATEAASTATESRIGFETEGGGNWKVWDRFITLDGKKAYHIGNICETCSFFFERLPGANDKISPTQLSSRFRGGLTEIDDDMLSTATAALPAGKYNVLLLQCVPRLVLPSTKGDYFAEEQVALWGVDGFWGLPHYTKTEYYRADLVKMGNGRGLFEFVVPMFPHNYLNAQTVGEYKAALMEGVVPTALAVSVLDVKQPANWDGEPEITKHWCLSHYLLDGHHKVFAACELGKPISILSFIAAEKGISNPKQISEAIQALALR